MAMAIGGGTNDAVSVRRAIKVPLRVVMSRVGAVAPAADTRRDCGTSWDGDTTPSKMIESFYNYRRTKYEQEQLGSSFRFPEHFSRVHGKRLWKRSVSGTWCAYEQYLGQPGGPPSRHCLCRRRRPNESRMFFKYELDQLGDKHVTRRASRSGARCSHSLACGIPSPTRRATM